MRRASSSAARISLAQRIGHNQLPFDVSPDQTQGTGKPAPAYISKQLGHSSIQIAVDLYGHFLPGADRHHVEGLAEAIEEAGRQLDATQPQPDPISKNHTEP